MYHSKVEDLHKLVLHSKSTQEQHLHIRQFFEMCTDDVKKEFLELLNIAKEIEEVTVEELIEEYKRCVLPSLVTEYAHPAHY